MKWLHRLGYALLWLAILALLTAGLAHLYGCGGAQVPNVPGTHYVLAHVANTAGPVFADWSVAHAECPDAMNASECAMVATQKDAPFWQAWDAFALAVNTGGDVVGAYCRVLAVLPPDAPPVLRVKGVCP